MATESVMVASMLERPSVGQTFITMPTHMTYISWFELPEEKREVFTSRLQEIVTKHRPPRPVADREEEFGNQKRGLETVRRLDYPTQGFNPLLDFEPHAILNAFVNKVDPSFDDTYFGVEWHPHIKNVNVPENEELIFDNLTVFNKGEKIGGKTLKVVQSVYPWERM